MEAQKHGPKLHHGQQSLGEAYRLAAGADLTQKLLHFMDSLAATLSNGLLHPFDLCIGVAGAVLVRLVVYFKGKNTKKYCQNVS